jgi:acetyl-CoA acyltransferase
VRCSGWHEEANVVEVLLVDAVRSPMWRGVNGSLVSPVQLLTQTITALLERTGINPTDLDELVVSCPYPAGEDGQTLGRAAWLSAGLPQHIPTTAINGAGQQALHLAAQQVRAQSCHVALVAGVDSANYLHREPSELSAPTSARPSVSCFQPSAAAAELVADKWGLDRQQLDAYAVRSHQRAHEVARAGEFDAEIVPISVPGIGSRGATVITRDETIDPAANAEALGALRAVLQDHPEDNWNTGAACSITAGNAAQPADGAAAMLLISTRYARRLLVRPRARLRSFTVAADDPAAMLAAPKRVTEKALTNAKLKLNQIDHVEVDEVFASVPLAWLAEFPVPCDMFNPRGGALALGKTPSCGAMRLMATMLNALEATGGRFGLQTLCGDAGMAAAAVVERL